MNVNPGPDVPLLVHRKNEFWFLCGCVAVAVAVAVALARKAVWLSFLQSQIFDSTHLLVCRNREEEEKNKAQEQNKKTAASMGLFYLPLSFSIHLMSKSIEKQPTRIFYSCLLARVALAVSIMSRLPLHSINQRQDSERTGGRRMDPHQ